MTTDLVLEIRDSTSAVSGQGELLAVLVTWNELLCLRRALHWYCEDRQFDDPELPADMCDDVVKLDNLVEIAWEAVEHAEHLRLSARAFRICAAVLGLQQPYPPATWQEEATHRLTRKLQDAELAVMVMETESLSLA